MAAKSPTKSRDRTVDDAQPFGVTPASDERPRSRNRMDRSDPKRQASTPRSVTVSATSAEPDSRSQGALE